MWIEETKYLGDQSAFKGFIDKEAPRAKAYAAIRLFEGSQSVTLRDRTEEFKAMLGGLAPDCALREFTLTGSDLRRDYGADWIVGSQFAQTFRVIVAE